MRELNAAQVDIELGKRVRELRKAKGLPILVMHQQYGVTHHKVWLLEKYGIIPKRSDREKIAAALGIPYTELWANVQE